VLVISPQCGLILQQCVCQFTSLNAYRNRSADVFGLDLESGGALLARICDESQGDIQRTSNGPCKQSISRSHHIPPPPPARPRLAFPAVSVRQHWQKLRKQHHHQSQKNEKIRNTPQERKTGTSQLLFYIGRLVGPSKPIGRLPICFHVISSFAVSLSISSIRSQPWNMLQGSPSPNLEVHHPFRGAVGGHFPPRRLQTQRAHPERQLASFMVVG